MGNQFSAKQVIKVLEKSGFNTISQKGSHIKLRKLGAQIVTIIVPNHKTIKPGTLRNIIRTSGLTKEEFLKLIRKK